MWKEIKGYRWPYRINEDAQVEKFYGGKWMQLTPYISGRERACVKMRTADNRKVDVPVVWLMADAFMGGRRPGMCITHRNGSKLDCSWGNLEFKTRRETGRISGGSRRKSIEKLDRDGNVVAIYRSAAEAAKKEFINDNAILNRCHRKVRNPYQLTGFDYRFENTGARKRNAEPVCN